MSPSALISSELNNSVNSMQNAFNLENHNDSNENNDVTLLTNDSCVKKIYHFNDTCETVNANVNDFLCDPSVTLCSADGGANLENANAANTSFVINSINNITPQDHADTHSKDDDDNPYFANLGYDASGDKTDYFEPYFTQLPNTTCAGKNGDMSNTNRLKIITWNVHGLGEKLKDRDFLQYISQYDLIIFLETMKLDRYVPDVGDFVYKHFQRKYQHPRSRRAAGGIAVLIRSVLASDGTVKIVKNSDFSVWIQISQNNIKSFIGGVYIPPLDSSSTISSFQNNNSFSLVQEEISFFSQKGNVAICGDFNARTGKLTDYVEVSGSDAFDIAPLPTNDNCEFPKFKRHTDDHKSNKYGRELIELCKSSNMRIMNGYFQNDKSTGTFTCYTPRGKSLIDYLICDPSFYQSLQSFTIEPLNINSDHRPLVFSIQLSVNESSQVLKQKDRYAKNSVRYFRYIFDSNSVSSLIESITNVSGLTQHEIFIGNIIRDEGVNEAVNSIYKLLENAISNNCAKKYQRTVKNSFPCNKWFDDECKKLKYLTNNFARKHDLNVEDNLDQYQSLKKSYKATIQRKKRIYQNSIRNELNNLECKNPTDYWKYWDKLKKNNKVTTVGTVSLGDFEDYFENMQSPPSESASKFDFEFLESVEQQLNDLINDSVEYMTDPPITRYEVETELKSLKQGKAPGVDGISNEFYKYLSGYLLDPLTTLFNYVWIKGDYPDKWSEGVIQPLHKKGSYNETDNYRKLTLMACMGKIFESIVNKRLVFQSEATNNVDRYQFGFTQGCRTSDNVFIIDSMISYQKSIRKNLFITFIDFSKAFDFVNRSFLYYKMIKKGYGGRLVKTIQSMFSKSQAKVRWQGELGSSINSTHGVLQGGIVSPKLFNLYMSDMEEYLDQSCGVSIEGTTFTHLLYADDLVLFSETKDGMQTLLNNIESYCRKWHLIINSQKSKVMIFHKKQSKNANSMNFSIDGIELEVVNSYKYLGHVLCNSKNIHKEMFAHLATQAQKAMYALKENTRSTVGYLPPKLSLKMFDTHVLPVLEYNSEIWFPEKEINDIEKIQLKFLKNMLNVRSQTPTTAILTDTGRYPLLLRQRSSALKYLDRLKNENCPVLLKKCLEIQLKLKENGVECWLTKLSKITDGLNVDLMNCDSNKTITSLYTNENEKMMTEINDNNKCPKLRTYKTFKIDMRLEPYLNYNLPKSIYTSIARFRLSSHNLNIELGRHKRPFVPAEDRICEKCNQNLVEDEFHCLMICAKWSELRKKLFEVACKLINGFLILSQAEQFHALMTSKNFDLNFALGKFLYTALKVDNLS